MTRIKKFIDVWVAGSIFHDDEISNPAGFAYDVETKGTMVEMDGRMVNEIRLVCIDRVSRGGSGSLGQA